MLGLYGIIRHWYTTEVGDRPDLVAHKASFDAACDVVDAMLQAKRGTWPIDLAAARGLEAMTRHMNAHRAIYGEDNIVPKHHWMFDVFEQMPELPCVIDFLESNGSTSV